MAILRRYLVAIVILAALLLSSCSPSPEPPSPSAPAHDKIRVAVLPYLGYLPFFIAQEEGYFRDQRLDVEFIRASTSFNILPLLVQGDLDVYSGTVNAGLLNAINRDAHIRLVADKGHFGASRHAYSAVMIRRDLVESGVLNDPARIKGLRASHTPAGSSQYLFDVLLASVGLTVDDIHFHALPPVMEMEALANGAIDIVSAAEPWITRISDSGSAVIWKTSPEVVPGFQQAVIVFGPALLEEKRDVGNRFMLAWLRAVRQYNQGKTEDNLRIAAAQTGLDVDLLKRMAWPLMRDDGRLHLQSVLDFQDWCVDKGFQDRPVPEENLYDSAFVEYANSALSEIPAPE